MFNTILAIDVEQRIPFFKERACACVKRSVYSKNSCEEALVEIGEPTQIDALLISIHQTVTEEFLKRFKDIRYIGVLGSSLKKIPVAFCQAHQIMVTNVLHYCDQETAEWVMLKTLEFFRQRPMPQSAFGKSIGVIGVGCVGKRVIELTSAFHMDVYGNSENQYKELSSPARWASKDEIFSQCDVVTIHTPAFLLWLTKEMLSKAKPNLCLINTCMGRISRGDDLAVVLKERSDLTLIMDKIAGDNYPELSARAKIFPEAAFLTSDSHNRLIDQFFANLLASCR